MAAVKSPEEFELELRSLVDEFFERDGMPEFPFVKLFRKELPLTELRDWYVKERHWETNLLFNQFTLPTLLERCPDDEGRSILWDVIHPEYGFGNLSHAHPTYIRQFYLAVGVPEEKLPIALDTNDSTLAKNLANLDALPFLDLLAERFLGPETIGPKVFGMYATALKNAYGMSDSQVEFFRLHGQEDVKDSDVIFKLVARYATTEATQEQARKALTRYYDRDRIRPYCAIRPIKFQFAEPVALEH